MPAIAGPAIATLQPSGRGGATETGDAAVGEHRLSSRGTGRGGRIVRSETGEHGSGGLVGGKEDKEREVRLELWSQTDRPEDEQAGVGMPDRHVGGRSGGADFVTPPDASELRACVV